MERPGKERVPSVLRGFYLHREAWLRFRALARDSGANYSALLTDALSAFLDTGARPEPLPGTDKKSVPVAIRKDVSDLLDFASESMELSYSLFANSAIQQFLNSEGETDERQSE